MKPEPGQIGDLLARVELTVGNMDRNDASGWVVVCIDLEAIQHGEADCVVACYGPVSTPEEALVQAGMHDASLDVDEGELGWTHLVKPLFPPFP